MKINYQKETKSNFQLQKSAQLQRVLNDVFTKSSFQFMNNQVFVNVVYVDLSKDLMNAKVLIDMYGIDEKHKGELVKKLNTDFIKQIRGILGQKLKYKYIPEVIFCFKEQNDKEKRVVELIEQESNATKQSN
ncbi:MAG: ribosome-binding factor A [Rickettsiales bacterium]|nr:ribosome-binding factor A [Rickettsiales bacterium]